MKSKEEVLSEIKDQVAKENFGYNYEAKGIMIDSFWQIVAERYADLRLAEYKEALKAQIKTMMRPAVIDNHSFPNEPDFLYACEEILKLIP